MSGLARIFTLESVEGRAAARALVARFKGDAAECRDAVAEILDRVRREGDAALLDYCRRFDAPDMTLAALKVTEAEFAEAERLVDAGLRESIAFAARRVEERAGVTS